MAECGHAHVFIRAQMRYDGAAFGGGFNDEQDFVFTIFITIQFGI
jgi:hypothetical protein